MIRNDILFKTHLNYHMNASLLDDSNNSAETIDYNSIDLRKCTFADFSKALKHSRDLNPDFNFMDSSIDSVKPANFQEAKKYNFIELAEYAKHTAVTIGNMTLFSELQKITSAIEAFVSSHDANEASQNVPIISFEDYSNYDIKQQPVAMEELGSCVISGGMDGSIKLTAYLHESSSEKQPIISIRFYSLNTGLYLTNRDLIDINGIYKPNANIIETFAYLSYQDYLHNRFNYSFDNLLISRSIEIDSLDDLYSKHFDLNLCDGN